ncbi:hypothetical protein B0P06_003977 [Clostridium saccharoperbutylacetonicum]|uniref:Uncharacterized protein n=1 Tax=Clostridium saccharoperbutylacetonicum N1-4(HMT) TaxID=931276 RepID=M1MNE6_9CLOT|nr:hypothetical protein Cspa_c39610 [Clostridium saccharoperbutylacetonicum N1-4(HMT)]AQR96414.1 hypothetical protein CLSAP_37380 [Clostridium saccharoperbutylacetonicum]NRT61514.1 hypothetical protein [Clostridium saccharoperbutylacetonicum]NSB24836.1 hypothetical protein [Clostridium saccharoperbutylacetonicum]NSB32287.1 hypothetical protein [Clostridium saccharoperbutylacetonicum]
MLDFSKLKFISGRKDSTRLQETVDVRKYLN